ncbi:uncharacterized protein B0I36DRAFT_346050 [Microdochium trichocladiopsis]|uniref:Uncharacterized protein n=1 Tax=Microdochium trichocladiopsis TaxID=1682393 RepID=A0A9P9BYG1_9PEZI|nr:uncharacterized protein B0I36DRAFT_346050 [Microdochium trichocladiopsis]KAH7038023.1 hypothetical protein B0I36DRAFT_346050 [Microdochium trichocladiopsis]
MASSQTRPAAMSGDSAARNIKGPGHGAPAAPVRQTVRYIKEKPFDRSRLTPWQREMLSRRKQSSQPQASSGASSPPSNAAVTPSPYAFLYPPSKAIRVHEPVKQATVRSPAQARKGGIRMIMSSTSVAQAGNGSLSMTQRVRGKMVTTMLPSATAPMPVRIGDRPKEQNTQQQQQKGDKGDGTKTTKSHKHTLPRPHVDEPAAALRKGNTPPTATLAAPTTTLSCNSPAPTATPRTTTMMRSPSPEPRQQPVSRKRRRRIVVDSEDSDDDMAVAAAAAAAAAAITTAASTVEAKQASSQTKPSTTHKEPPCRAMTPDTDEATHDQPGSPKRAAAKRLKTSPPSSPPKGVAVYTSGHRARRSSSHTRRGPAQSQFFLNGERLEKNRFILA